MELPEWNHPFFCLCGQSAEHVFIDTLTPVCSNCSRNETTSEIWRLTMDQMRRMIERLIEKKNKIILEIEEGKKPELQIGSGSSDGLPYQILFRVFEYVGLWAPRRVCRRWYDAFMNYDSFKFDPSIERVMRNPIRSEQAIRLSIIPFLGSFPRGRIIDFPDDKHASFWLKFRSITPCYDFLSHLLICRDRGLLYRMCPRVSGFRFGSDLHWFIESVRRELNTVGLADRIVEIFGSKLFREIDHPCQNGSG